MDQYNVYLHYFHYNYDVFGVGEKEHWIRALNLVCKIFIDSIIKSRQK